jgi:predicted Zn-dependent protease
MFELSCVREELSARASGDWEIYAKRAASREIRRSAHRLEEAERHEDGFAVRWRENGRTRFAAASSPEALLQGIRSTAQLAILPGEAWISLPRGNFPEAALPSPTPPADLFEPLSQLLASESKGQARLISVSASSGGVLDRIENGSGFAGSRAQSLGYGNARAIGLAGDRRVTADLLFPLEAGSADLGGIARALADRATLPLKGRPVPFPRGELLLDPAVSSVLLSSSLPLFCGEKFHSALSAKYLDRAGRLTSEDCSLVDDSCLLLPFDAEGTPTRENVVVSHGIFAARLHDLTSARRAGEPATGSAQRPSFRDPPAPGSARFSLRAERGISARQLLERVSRGVYASAAVSPMRVDLENDRYRLEIEGWAIQGAKARAPVSRAVLSGRLSQLWARLSAAGNDLRWFFLGTRVGAPTLLFDRVNFE